MSDTNKPSDFETALQEIASYEPEVVPMARTGGQPAPDFAGALRHVQAVARRALEEAKASA